MRICCRCKENPATCNKDRWCRLCKQQYDREYWAKTKNLRNDRKRINSKAIRIRNRQYLWDYYLTHPCVDCGNNDPRVLQSDHQNNKITNVSDLMSSSLSVIQEELSKCMTRCANCHTIKTGIQLGWYAWLNNEV